MTDMPRKFVKPAHPGACIPDLAHGTDLPQGGAFVVWDPYWIGRALRGEVVEADPPDDAEPASAVEHQPTT